MSDLVDNHAVSSDNWTLFGYSEESWSMGDMRGKSALEVEVVFQLSRIQLQASKA